MNRRNTASILLLIALLLVAMLVSSACGGKEKEAAPPQEVILEPGLITSGEPDNPTQPDTSEPDPENDPTEEPVEEDFTDLGRASTINDLMANKKKIHSYYFEQTQDNLFIRTWYADGWMKIVIAFADGEESTEYFDCENLILVSHTPAAGDYGVMMDFEQGDSDDMPQNHLSNDYHQYRVLETDNIEGQICRVLEGSRGEKLWVSTMHGFPLQVEFTDPTNDEHYTVLYENLTFNQVQAEDVAIPDDLEIIQF